MDANFLHCNKSHEINPKIRASTLNLDHTHKFICKFEKSEYDFQFHVSFDENLTFFTDKSNKISIKNQISMIYVF